MENIQAVEAIRRASREAELSALEEQTRQNEAAELVEALEKVPGWRREYDEAKRRAVVLRGEIVVIDSEIPEAVEVLRLAHETLQNLLAQRSEAERSVNLVHQRLSRLAGWIGGINWMQDSVNVPASPVGWRLQAFMEGPFPE